MAAIASQPKSPTQLRAIFAEGRKQGLGHEELREVAESVTNRTRSLSELTHAEAESMLRRLKGSGFVPLRTLQHRRKQQGVEQIVRPGQIKLIAKLASQRAWSKDALVHFCDRQCGFPRPRTTTHANKVIEALKSMNRRDELWCGD
jgi:Protein of unknown function (DUF1018)